MKRKPILLVLLCVMLQTLSSTQENTKRMECNGSSKENRALTKKLWDGYEVSLGPARNATEDAGCTAAIYNARTQVVFRATEYTVFLFEKWTGKDIDGDGHPDVVFVTEPPGMPYGTLIVISLYPKPHKLFAFDGIGNFDRDKLGRIVISERVMMSNSFTGQADRPVATRIWRIENEKLADKTREYCGEIVRTGNEDFDEQQRVLTPSALKQFSDSPKADSPALEPVFSSLLSRAMQEAFCGEGDKVLRDLNYIPATERETAKQEFARGIQDTEPELAKRLKDQ